MGISGRNLLHTLHILYHAYLGCLRDIRPCTISKPLFRKTTISQNNYFEKQLFRKLCNATTISQKKLFRKTSISQKKTISQNHYFAKLLFRKTTISKNNYFENNYFEK